MARAPAVFFHLELPDAIVNNVQQLLLILILISYLLGERSEPHTGVFNWYFVWYIYIYVSMSVVYQNA